MMAVMARVDAGSIKWNDFYKIKKEDQVGGSGKLKEVKAGARISLKQLTELMIIESDNTATEVLTDIIGLDAVTKKAKDLGMAKTVMGRRIWDFDAINRGKDNLTTARDLSTFFYKINACANNKINISGLSSSSCRMALDILKRQKNRKMIPRYLPEEVKVAHKTGELTGIVGDAGIVYIGNNPVIICFLSNQTNNLQAREGIADLAKMTVHYLQKGAK